MEDVNFNVNYFKEEEKQPQTPEGYWLLIAGTSDSKGTKYTDKISDDNNCNFVEGVSADLANIEATIKEYAQSGWAPWALHNIVNNTKDTSKADVIDTIKECAQECKKQAKGREVVIYYTGHGETNTGNWCFADGVVTLSDVYNAVLSVYPKVDTVNLMCDCNYSGNWCMELKQMKLKKKHVDIKAGSWPDALAYNSQYGGLYTLMWTNKCKWKAKDKPNFKWCSAWKKDGYWLMNKHWEDQKTVLRNY